MIQLLNVLNLKQKLNFQPVGSMGQKSFLYTSSTCREKNHLDKCKWDLDTYSSGLFIMYNDKFVKILKSSPRSTRSSNHKEMYQKMNPRNLMQTPSQGKLRQQTNQQLQRGNVFIRCNTVSQKNKNKKTTNNNNNNSLLTTIIQLQSKPTFLLTCCLWWKTAEQTCVLCLITCDVAHNASAIIQIQPCNLHFVFPS